MDASFKVLEDQIKDNLGEWLWQHKRWKQEGYRSVHRQFKFDSYLIILPRDEDLAAKINNALNTFRLMFQKSFFTVMAPKSINSLSLEDADLITYSDSKELFIDDYSFQMIFDFSENKKLCKHFLKRGAFKSMNLEEMLMRSSQKRNSLDYSKLIVDAVCLNGATFD